MRIGKQLGDGAFGVVVEAWATGIVSRLEETKVAVKMLKDVAGNEVNCLEKKKCSKALWTCHFLKGNQSVSHRAKNFGELGPEREHC